MRYFIPFIALLSTYLPSTAQIFVKQDATGILDGTSWANAYTDLQKAIDGSNPGDQIWIAAGTYFPKGPTPDSSHFLVVKPVEIYGGFTGNETSLSERNWVDNLTVLSGDLNSDDIAGDFFNKRLDNAHHIMIINAGFIETVVDGLIIQNGATRLDSYVPGPVDVPINRWLGAGIYINKSNVTIRNCTFLQNNAFRGAGIYAGGDVTNQTLLKIEHSYFNRNNAGTRGAGALIEDWIHSVISNCVFLDNASGAVGGGLAVGNSNTSIQACTFSRNFSNFGGGCMIYHNSLSILDHASLEVSKSIFTDNNGLGGGGGMRVSNFVKSFDFTMDSCLFSGNFNSDAYPAGGALSIVDVEDQYLVEPTNSITIHGSTFTDNASAFGAGIYLEAGDDSLRIHITNSNITNNTGISGGGLYISNYGSLSRIKSTMSRIYFMGNTVTGLGGSLMFDNYQNGFRHEYYIDSCQFEKNTATVLGGAIYSAPIQPGLGLGCNGTIRNSQFFNNQTVEASGAIESQEEIVFIENCQFEKNYTSGTYSTDYNGGGALSLNRAEQSLVRNTIFKNNKSEQEGAAVFIYGGDSVRLENVLLNDNAGNSAIFNGGKLSLLNTTFIDNEMGLILKDSSKTQIQNSIFRNTFDNLLAIGTANIISKGGNISSDGSMSTALTGFGNYVDLHNTDPMLGPDFVPLTGSPAIDAGNPEGVMSAYDLAGNPRIQGGGIDIGAYESFTVAVKNAIWNSPNVSIYPNPANGILNLKLESEWTGPFGLVLYDNLGHQVLNTTKVKSGNLEVFNENINYLLPGEYVLLAFTGNKTYASRVIIQ